MCKINEAAVYCGTYKKYNEASIFGKWMNLADYASKEEFLEACAELHKDEKDPEFMFQDWENIPEGMIGESWIDERVFGLIHSDTYLEEEVIDAYLRYFGLPDDEDADDLVEKIEDKYFGYFESDADFAEHMIEEGCYEVPDFLAPYIDYERLGRDLAMDYAEMDGYYFFNY